MSARPKGSSLPARPHPTWYRKAAKKKLASLHAVDPDATLSRAQFEVARDHGFASWRALIAAIDATRGAEGPTGDLHAAVTARDLERVRALIDSGSDLEQRRGEAGHTALSWAVTLSAFDIATVLLEHGARTDLFCAAATGDLAVVRSFFDRDGQLTRDAAYTSRVRFLSSALPRAKRPVHRDIVSEAMYAAVRHSRVEVARDLIDRGVDLQSQAYLGATLLHWARYVGADAIVEILIAHGADSTARDCTFDCTPRAFAICAPSRLGLVSQVAARLDEDPSLATIHEGRGTPLHEAARAGKEDLVRLLLAYGADPGVRDGAGRVPRDLIDGNANAWAAVLL